MLINTHTHTDIVENRQRTKAGYHSLRQMSLGIQDRDELKKKEEGEKTSSYSGTCAPDACVTPPRVQLNVGPFTGPVPRENSCLTTSGSLQMFGGEQSDTMGARDDRETYLKEQLLWERFSEEKEGWCTQV